MSSLKTYTIPDWGGFHHYGEREQEEHFSLEVLRDGVSMEMLNLNELMKKGEKEFNRLNNDNETSIEVVQKSFLTFGRAADCVDIVLENPSISRQHAVLQISKLDGSVHIMDWGSGHGTYVNKMALLPNSFKKLHVGDFIKFGSSTRMYLLHGPERFQEAEYDSENLQNFREKLQQRSLELQNRKEESEGVMWGMTVDDEEYDSDENENEEEDNGNNDVNKSKKRNAKRKGGFVKEKKTINSDSNEDEEYSGRFKYGSELFATNKNTGENEAEINDIIHKCNSFIKESQEKNINKNAVEKLRTKSQKLTNIHEEMKRLLAKESSQEDGLTDRQQFVFEKAKDNIEKITNEIEDLLHEQGIRKKNELKTQKNKKSNKSDNNDDDDAVFDTTMETVDISSNWRLRRKNKMNENQDVLRDLQHTSTGSVTYEELQARQIQVKSKLEVTKSSFEEKQNQLEKLLETKKTFHEEKMIKNEDENKLKTAELSDAEIFSTDFVLESDEKEIRSSLKHLSDELESLEKQYSVVSKLAKAAAPALQSLVKKNLGNNQNSINGNKETKLVNEKNDSRIVQVGKESFLLPPALAQQIKSTSTSTSTSVPIHSSQQSSSGHGDSHMSKENKLIETPVNENSHLNHHQKQGNDMNHGNHSLLSVSAMHVEDASAKKARKHSISSYTSEEGNYATLLNSNIEEYQDKRNISNDQTDTLKSSVVTSGYLSKKSKLEDGEYAWVPPTDQKGTGETSLNKKLGY